MAGFVRAWLTTTLFLLVGSFVAAPVLALFSIEDEEGFGLSEAVSAGVIAAVVVFGQRMAR